MVGLPIPIFYSRNPPKTDPQPVPIRASFLPYTGSSQYEDDDDLTPPNQSPPATVRFKQAAAAVAAINQSEAIATITDRPFVGILEEISLQHELPSASETQTLSVSNLSNLTPTKVQPEVKQTNHPHIDEFLGCFRPFIRMFAKTPVSASCESINGKFTF